MTWVLNRCKRILNVWFVLCHVCSWQDVQIQELHFFQTLSRPLLTVLVLTNAVSHVDLSVFGFRWPYVVDGMLNPRTWSFWYLHCNAALLKDFETDSQIGTSWRFSVHKGTVGSMKQLSINTGPGKVCQCIRIGIKLQHRTRWSLSVHKDRH